MGIYEIMPPPITSETQIMPEQIKGYMTLEEVSIGLKMDLSEVYEKLVLPTYITKDTKLNKEMNIYYN